MPSKHQPNDRLLVPVTCLADAIRPFLDRLQALHETTYVASDDEKSEGAFASLTTDVAHTLGIRPYSVIRRLYDIRNLRSVHIDLTYADAILESLGLRLEDSAVPVLPSNLPSAREMVDVRCPEMRPIDRARLARSVLRFSRAFLEESTLPETLTYIAEQNAKTKVRRDRHRAKRKAVAA